MVELDEEVVVGAAGRRQKGNGMDQRRALLADQVGTSLGAERVAGLTDEQRAILGLQDYAPAPPPGTLTAARA